MATGIDKDSEPPSPLSSQVFQILLSLLDEQLHGYALIQDIRPTHRRRRRAHGKHALRGGEAIVRRGLDRGDRA